MKNKTIFLYALFCLSALSVIAQNIPGYTPGAPLPCRAEEQMNEFYKAHPGAMEEHRSPVKGRGNVARPDSYVIPVVFHIFGESFNGSHITDEIVRDALKKTNEDFHGITSNWGDDDPEFDRCKKTMNITFRLADKTPEGAATTGIIYHQLESGFGNYGAPRLPLYAWDNRRYMNVYIMNDLYGDGETNNSGVSWYPDEYMTSKNIARVVYNGAYLGTNAGLNDYGENFRRVLTHEFGHFLNLAHTFDYDTSIFKDGCNDANGLENPGDYVDDTPPADRMLMGVADLNCKGEKTNWTNFMNYSYIRTSMFTAGQVERMLDALDHSSRVTLWSESTDTQVFFDNPDQKRIALCSRGDLLEASTNDGEFTDHFEFTLMGGGKLSDKTYVYGTDFTMENLPEGLIPRLTRASDSSLMLYLDGKALRHSSSDDVSNLSIRFADNMLSTDDGLYRCDLSLSLNFRDSYKLYYSGLRYSTVSSSLVWIPLNLSTGYENSSFGIMCDFGSGRTGNLFIESYGKPMVGTGRGQNLQWLDCGEKIGKSSQWVACGDYPALGTLCSKSFDYWKGKAGFVGFQFEGTTSGEILYGWMRIVVADDGNSFTLIDYAFNEQPGEEIAAGQKDENTVVSEVLFGASSVNEDAELNDGSITEKLSVLIMGDNSFNKTGVLTPGTDYELEGVPTGLIAKLEAVSSTKAILSFSGKAERHEARNSESYVFSLKSSVFTKPDIANPSLDLNFNFLNAYRIKTGTGGWAVNPSEPWMFFNIDDLDATDYGAWVYSSGVLKLETYLKPMVCLEGTSNIAPLMSGVEIGPESNWKAPDGSYGSQLDLRKSGFTQWDGRTAYTGFRFENYGKTLYGWFKITVVAEGSSFSVDEWAYNENPEHSILTGQTEITGFEKVESEQASVFPNPAKDEMNIVAPNNTIVRIYDITGNLIWTGSTTTGITTISVTSWTKGFYLVCLTKKDLHIVKKVIVK